MPNKKGYSSTGHERESWKKYDPDKPIDKNNHPRIETGYDNVADMFDDMFEDHRSPEEKALQEARVMSFLSGVPFIGPFIQGVDRARQLEDLYDKTGKVPAYPSLSGSGYGGIGHSVGNAAVSFNRIANGFNDLYQFYSGEPDNFRQMMNGAYL